MLIWKTEKEERMQKDEKYVQGLVSREKGKIENLAGDDFKKYICAGNLYIYQLLFFPAGDFGKQILLPYIFWGF